MTTHTDTHSFKHIHLYTHTPTSRLIKFHNSLEAVGGKFCIFYLLTIYSTTALYTCCIY